MRCPACDEPVPPMKSQGNPRRWCSERCRVFFYRNGPRRKKRCEGCNELLPLRSSTNKRWCSDSCRLNSQYEPTDGSAWVRVEYTCEGCGQTFRSKDDARIRFCSQSCSQSATNFARRVARYGSDSESFARTDIFERDGWICGLCNEEIDQWLGWPDPMSASLDHIVPLSQGGAHSRANTQATHLRCNIAKGARPQMEQLRLVG